MTRSVAFLFLALLTGCAGPAVPSTVAPLAADDEAVIRALEEQERTAVLDRDTAALQRIWHERFTVNTPANRVAPGAAVVLGFVRQGLIHYSSFERRIEHLHVDGDLAIVMGSETVQPLGANPYAGQTVQRRFSHVWRREGGSWRLIARHANVIPPPPS